VDGRGGGQRAANVRVGSRHKQFATQSGHAHRHYGMGNNCEPPKIASNVSISFLYNTYTVAPHLTSSIHPPITPSPTAKAMTCSRVLCPT
jgi:hypothetical protein